MFRGSRSQVGSSSSSTTEETLLRLRVGCEKGDRSGDLGKRKEQEKKEKGKKSKEEKEKRRGNKKEREKEGEKGQRKSVLCAVLLRCRTFKFF